MARCWRMLTAARPHALSLCKKVLSASAAIASSAVAAARQVALSVASGLGGIARTAAKMPAAIGRQRNAVAGSAGKDDAAASQRAPTAPAISADSRLVEPTPAAPRPAFAAQPAIAPDQKETTEISKPADAPAEQRSAPFLLSLMPRRWLLAGLAAASIGFLLLAFGLNPAGAPDRKALTLSIPERPVSDFIPEAAAQPSAALPADETAASDGGAELSESDDPLNQIIAYVGELPAVEAAVVSPVLARAETIEGLARFTQAAEIVGLERLLQPGEAYTVFAPDDAAFAKLAPGEVDGLFDPSGHERLLTLLSHHILPERLIFDDIAGGVREYTSLAGQVVTIDAGEVIRIGDAGVVQAGFPADNGVLHVIDQVLVLTEP